MKRLPLILVAAALALAAGSGYFISQALGTSTQAPTRTVTIDVATGPQGPAGPEGPPGPAGLECIAGYSPAIVVINAPGGQHSIYTCLKD